MEFDMGSQGWTESHFYTSPVPLTDAGLYDAAVNLVAARTFCLDGRYAQLVDCRMSLDNVNRDSEHLRNVDIPVPTATGGYSGGPPPGSGVWTYNGPFAAWPVLLETSNPTTNPLEYITIGSIVSTQTGRSPNSAPGLNVEFYIQKYIAELVNGNWGALGRNWGGGGGVTYTVTANAFVGGTNGGPNQFSFTLQAPFPAAATFPIGAYVRLQGSTYTTPQSRLRLNGTYTVVGYNATTGVLTVNAARVKVAPTWTALGGIQVASAAVFPYRSGVVRPLTHRKRGRPLDASRGRR